MVTGDDKMDKKYSNSSNIQIFDAVMDAICKTTEAIDIVLKEETVDFSHLGHLMNTNQRLLEAIKVGSEIIDEIVTIANKHKVGIKISGAGFGGWMIAVYNPLSKVSEFKDDIHNLSDKGVSILHTYFSKAGVSCDSWEYA